MVRSNILFKIADEAAEFEQIHALNYRTFVEEIPQHPPNVQRLLIDRFHAENTYIIGMDGMQLAGMLAVRDTRPFSLDEKFQALGLDTLESYLPPAQHLGEVRLLSIAPAYRRTRCLQGILKLLVVWCQSRGCDQVVISATTRQWKLYRHLGFVPFGPLLGTPEACFQPMVLSEADCGVSSLFPSLDVSGTPSSELLRAITDEGGKASTSKR